MSNCRVLVPLPEVRSEPLGRECRVQNSRPPENSQAQGILFGESSQGGLYLNTRPSSTQLPAASNSGHLTLNKKQDKDTTHPSAERLLKLIQSLQTPQNTPPDMALPIREKRLSSTHQKTGTSPSNQEAYRSYWTNFNYIMIKGTIQEQDKTIVNIYAPNIEAPQYIRQMLTAIKGEIDSDTIIVGEFNTPLTPMDRSSR